MFDSTIIGSALATGLTEQIQLEFDKEGSLIKKLAGGGGRKDLVPEELAGGIGPNLAAAGRMSSKLL